MVQIGDNAILINNRVRRYEIRDMVNLTASNANTNISVGIYHGRIGTP